MPLNPTLVMQNMTYPDVRWTSSTITYSIAKDGSQWLEFYNYPTSEARRPGYGVLSAEQAQAFRGLMSYIGTLIATPIVETDDVAETGQIRVAFTDTQFDGGNAGAYANLPGSSEVSGDIWLGLFFKTISLRNGPDEAAGEQPISGVLHEIGHALGLTHTFEKALLPAGYDNQRYSLMSYTPFDDRFVLDIVPNSSSPSGLDMTNQIVTVQGYGLFDILVLQTLYGANPKTNAEATRYTWDDKVAVISTIYDAGGVDVFDLSGHQRPSVIDLTPGSFSSIDIYTAEAQRAYWLAKYPDKAKDVNFFTDSLLSQKGLFTWENNVGIAYDTTIENVIAGEGNDIVKGNTVANVIDGGGGDDQLFGGDGDDILTGGAGSDLIDGGAGNDTARYANTASSYAITVDASGWKIADLRTGHTTDIDTLRGIEWVAFADKALNHALSLAVANVVRAQPSEASAQVLLADLSPKVSSGLMNTADLAAALVEAAVSTTSVATLNYEFFTGKVPTQAGFDYLVSATGSNPTNLNSAYYAQFNAVNRYINFAVNLGKNGEAKDSFAAKYGAMSLFDATREAYKTIFGSTPSDEKVHALIDTRVDFLAWSGGDGPEGIGTKAAMVGFLLAAAATEDVGIYAKSNDAFLADLMDGAAYAVDLVGVYGKPEFVYPG